MQDLKAELVALGQSKMITGFQLTVPGAAGVKYTLHHPLRSKKAMDWQAICADKPWPSMVETASGPEDCNPKNPIHRLRKLLVGRLTF